jgi:hypothetical protein
LFSLRDKKREIKRQIFLKENQSTIVEAKPSQLEDFTALTKHLVCSTLTPLQIKN